MHSDSKLHFNYFFCIVHESYDWWAKNIGVSMGCIFFHKLQPITIFFLLALKSTTHAQSQHFHILAINVQWCVLANVKEERCTCVLTLLLIWDTGHILKHIESKFCLLVCDWYAVISNTLCKRRPLSYMTSSWELIPYHHIMISLAPSFCWVYQEDAKVLILSNFLSKTH